MATRAVGRTGDTNDTQFVDRIVEFRNQVQLLEKEIEDKQRAHSEAGKVLRDTKKRKSELLEAITKYVMSAQKDLI